MRVVLLLTLGIMGCAHNLPPEPSWVKETVEITEVGVPSSDGTDAQKKLMAKRASRVLAIKKLQDYIHRLPVDNETIVADYLRTDWTPKPDDIKAYHDTNGTWVTTVVMSLQPVWDEVVSVYPNK